MRSRETSEQSLQRRVQAVSRTVSRGAELLAELNVSAGSHRVLVLGLKGDLRMQSGSPDIANGEPVFSWKSGSLLDPKHYWPELGFMLRLVLCYDPKALPKSEALRELG